MTVDRYADALLITTTLFALSLGTLVWLAR
jgi:hypothetical protein